jgi:uncharacterized protein
MPVREEVVTIRNSAGLKLYCMLARPEGALRKDVACVLLSPGVKMRVAPHRMYRKLAADFLARGIAVLRVDFHGLGDSEGELLEGQLDQLYRAVQLGRHVDDARSAFRWLERELGIRKFIVGGLCGGALTGLLAAEVDESVAALYSVGIPVVLDGSGEPAAQNMTQGQLRDMRKGYLAKLFSPSAWMRLFSMRSDLRSILRSLFPRLFPSGPKGVFQASADVPPPSSAPAANLNPRYAPAFFRLMQRSRPALLIFSGADRLQFEYQEKFVALWREPLEKFTGLLRVDVIPNANHVLGDPDWIRQAREITAQWLDLNFGEPV